MVKGNFFLVKIVSLFWTSCVWCPVFIVRPDPAWSPCAPWILLVSNVFSWSLYEAEFWHLGWASADVKLVCHFMSESFWANSHELWLTGLLSITCHGFSDNGFVSMAFRDGLDQSYILWVLGVQPTRDILCGNRVWHAVQNLSGVSKVFTVTWQCLLASAPRVQMSVVEFGSLASGLNTGVYKSWKSFGITRTLIPHGCDGGDGQ